MWILLKTNKTVKIFNSSLRGGASLAPGAAYRGPEPVAPSAPVLSGPTQ